MLVLPILGQFYKVHNVLFNVYFLVACITGTLLWIVFLVFVLFYCFGFLFQEYILYIYWSFSPINFLPLLFLFDLKISFLFSLFFKAISLCLFSLMHLLIWHLFHNFLLLFLILFLDFIVSFQISLI